MMESVTLVDPKSDGIHAPNPLEGDALRYSRPRGHDLAARSERFLHWQRARARSGYWPYFREMQSPLSRRATLVSENGTRTTGPNFGAQDYLSLSGHPRVREAAARALRDFGTIAAGSPALNGRTPLSTRLEAGLAEAAHAEHVVLFPTGWAAGYGTIRSLLHRHDHVLLDQYAHDSLRQGASASGAREQYFPHLDNAAVAAALHAIRATDTANAVLVVTEGVFSMDSDTARLRELLELCHAHRATLLVDVAHDFGALGEDGGGQLELQGVLGEVDLVVGAFSKSFATTGGFLATHSPAIREHVKLFGGPQTFSSALTPVQCAVALEALRIIRSPEGGQRRRSVAQVAQLLRDGLTARGHVCLGDVVSPVVPVLVGDTAVARVGYGMISREGLIANLVETPAVPFDAARFRLQAMAEHTFDDVAEAVDILDTCIARAAEA